MCLASATSERSQYSRTYLLSSGQRQAVISSVPVNYRTSSGQWAPISTQVTGSSRPGYAFENTTNTFRSFFGSRPGQVVRFEVPGGGWLEMSLNGAQLSSPRVSENTVAYPQVMPGTGLSYQVTPTALREDITLASPSAPASFSYTIKVGGGLVPWQRPDGQVVFSRGSAGTAPVLMLPAPYMASARIDPSSPYGKVWSPRVSQRMAWDAATRTLQLTVTPDAAWLDAPGRVFPVVIDPTVEIVPDPSSAQNVMIESDTPSTNYDTSWQLSVGTTATADVRALLQFPLTAIPSGTQIDSADLQMYYDQEFANTTSNITAEAHQATAAWDASTATWSNASNNVGQLGDNQVTVDDSDTASTSASGSWPSQSDSSAINGEYVYDQDTVSGGTFTWVPDITEAGGYSVAAHYVADSAAASNAPYTVYYNGGSQAYQVNQQSGSGGVWATLGTQNFAAGTAGKVVLGDGPASATTRVEADAVQFTKPASVVTPSVANAWDVYPVRNIVQSWLDGTSPNYGFVVKDANETTLNQGGVRYEASQSAYNGETANYPQLVVTYGLPGVTLNPVTTINATGADLSWTPYTNPTTNPSDNLAQYMVYRSVSPSLTPDASTLVSPVPAGTTSFDDTTAPPTPPGDTSENTMYYMVAVQTQDGTIIPGPTELAQLPNAGFTEKIIDASGATTLSQAQPDTNEQHLSGQPWLEVGNDNPTYGVTRTVVNYPSMANVGIPGTATVTGAELKLWGWYNNNGDGSATYDVHALTQDFDPATATWNDASSGTPWTTAGGAFSPTVTGSVSGLTSAPSRLLWPVTSTVQGWVTTPSSEHGLLLKLFGETSTSPQEQELFLDTSAAEAALRPELVVTYTEPTPEDTYYAPDTPQVSAAASSYTTDVTVTNTTTSTWSRKDWALSYHWLAPDGTDVTTSSDVAETALPSDLAPGAQATLTATVDTPATAGSGNARTGYQLLWDMWDKVTGTWLSSGTSTPNLTGTGGAGTVGPLNQVTSAAETAEMLGLEKYYQYTGIATGSGSVLENNDATGNTVWNYNPFSNPSRGFQTFVRLDYNSMDTSESSMGFGWSLQASTLTRLGTPLDFHPKSNPTTITLTDGNGGSHAFTWNSSNGTWTSPPGFHYYLQSYAACNVNGKDNPARAWLITAPDRTQFFFDCEGYQTAVVDKNGNEADFTYTSRKSENKPEEFLDYITDPSGRQTLTISYYTKGQNYSYVDDSTSPPTVVPATNLTNPDIIDQIQSITDVSGREITFLYDKQGLMSQMTDGAGTSVAKTFQFGYDMTQGNKNVKLVSVTDPRGNATNLAYYTAPQNPIYKWALNTVTDRLQHTTTWNYTAQTGGGVQTAVTDPLSHTTTYLIDSTGRPVQITSPRGFNTYLAWDTDNNLTSLKEDNGATTTWTWNPDTGYPLTMTDAQANHDGTAGYTYGYQFSLSGHVADLTSLLTPQQRLWTFGYDSFGNLTSVTKPLGNVSGATAGSYTTQYQYNTDGTLHTATDPDGNTTTYSAYDPPGYPGAIKDARGNTTSYVYSATGNVTSVTDAYNKTTTQQYDIFGRPGQKTVPKTSTQTITTAAPVYDGNDNVTTSYAPSYSSTAPGPATSYVYDASDQLDKKVTPADTSSSPSPTTTYQYYADNTLQSVTTPDGNVSGANASQFTTTYTYFPDQTVQSVTDGLGNVTSYTYDDVGNTQSATDPNGNTTKYQYNLNHKLTQVTDAASHSTITGYDLDGLVKSVTDANNNTTLYTLDADGQITQQEVPAQAPGAAVTYDTTQYAYDQAGNRTQVLTPRAIAAGYSLSSSCVSTPTTSPCPYTWVTGYNGDNTVDSQQSPANPGDPTYPGPQTTSYTHDKDNRLSNVTLPSSNGSLSVPNTTTYSYFDNGWLSSSADPRGVTTTWDYNAYGEQSTRTLDNTAVTAMNRSQSWSYYPDGKLQSLTDNGVPTGMYAEVVDNTDASNASWSPSSSWPSTSCTSGCDGYSYQANSSGSGTFTWHLDIPADGKYTIYVKYPQVSGAATGAAYQVSYSSGGSASVTVNQTQNTGTWVKLGEWSFTRAGTGQQVTLTANSTGTAIANAVEAVRDNSGTSNSANNGYNYTYDADGNPTGVTTTSTTTSSTGSATSTTGSDVVAYDQLDRISSVQENNSSGTQQYLTSYTYDPASNLKTLTHASGPSGSATTDQYSTYNYNNLNQLQNETDGTSATDPSPKVTLFTYTPTGQLSTEVKPNNGNTIANPAGNLVTDTYYTNHQLYTQTEYTNDSTTTGTLVSSHTYQYDPNGNQTQDIQKLMSGDNSASYLSHTLNYAYNPLDQLATVTTDGTQTEQYYHDPEGNVTSQTINGTTTSYNYNRGLLETATSGGSTAYYNYDPLGRLDTITSGSPGGTILETNTYDGFDNLITHTQATSTGTTTTSYTYDPLNRLASQTTGTATTSYSYLGLTSELNKETDPGSQTKNYSYTPSGMRLFQTTTSSTGTVTPGYYTYNNHGDVEAVTGTNGNTTATYGYTAYGSNITSMFTGADKNNTQPGSSTTPYNSYRYNAMRWDPGSGQYDMGFRNYDPGLNAFTSRDMYNGALADVSLTTDPFTGSRYAFGNGNPISNIENDGHVPMAMAAGGCAPSIPGCAGYHQPAASSSGGCGILSCIEHFGSDFLHGVASTTVGLVKGAWQTSTQPVRDLARCAGLSAAGCANFSEDITLGPLPSLVKTITGASSLGKAIGHEFASGHVGEALGSIATLAAAVLITRRLGLAPEEGESSAVGNALERWSWPPNRGFLGDPVQTTLKVGTRIDRYGYPGGTFVSPAGTPFPERALLPSTINSPYNLYEVTQPLEVRAGTVASWFGYGGGGIQYELPQSVADLIEQGFLKRVGP
jgi:RHS repeat-associated protein